MKKNNVKLTIIFLMVSMLIFIFQPIVSAKEGKEYNITFNTGAVGGLYMAPAVIWAEECQKEIPNLKISVILGGGMTNPIVVTEADPNEAIGITDLGIARQAYEGTGDFFGEKAPGGLKNLRTLWRFNVMSYGFLVVQPGAVPKEIKTLGELLAKKIPLKWALKVRGSLDELFARQVFASYGVTYDDIKSWGGSISFNHPDDCARLLIDGKADAHFAIVRAPSAYVLNMDASIKGLRWLKFSQDSIDYLVKQHGYIPCNYPLGVYSSVKESFPTVAVDHLVFVDEGMDEEIVYQMTKVVLSHPDLVREAIPAMKPFDPTIAYTNTVFPLHEGAERAYRELGLIK